MLEKQSLHHGNYGGAFSIGLECRASTTLQYAKGSGRIQGTRVELFVEFWLGTQVSIQHRIDIRSSNSGAEGLGRPWKRGSSKEVPSGSAARLTADSLACT